MFLTPTDSAALLTRTLLIRKIAFYRNEIAQLDRQDVSDKSSICRPFTASNFTAIGTAILGAASNDQTIIQAVSSLFARTETAASSSGDVATSTFNALVADKMRQLGFNVAIPSAILPVIFADAESPTQLQNQIDLMQNDLSKLDERAAKREAVPICAIGKRKIAADVSLLDNTISAFYASIISSGSSSGTIASAPGSSALQIGLYAEEILKVSTRVGQDLDDNSSVFVTINALDSGGSTLTKKFFPSSSELFFSGGATLSFLAFTPGGRLICGGTGLGHRGFIRERQIESAIDPDGAKTSPVGVAAISDTCAIRTNPKDSPSSKTQ